MMARVFSCAVIGLEGVIVEVDISYGWPGVTIFGLLVGSPFRFALQDRYASNPFDIVPHKPK